GPYLRIRDLHCAPAPRPGPYLRSRDLRPSIPARGPTCAAETCTAPQHPGQGPYLRIRDLH
ncbi:hypothetical protein NDU88_007403, partial [Pleurodeles waltl]